MKKAAKLLVKNLEGLGYYYAGRNTKSCDIYEHDNGDRIAIGSSANDQTCRSLLKQAQERCGVAAAPTNKRNTVAIKDRQAVERDRQKAEIASHRALIDSLIAERSRMLAGHAAGLSDRDVLAIEDAIERADRELAALVRLMTGVPAAADHRGTGRARHRAGAA